jgi:uncharacterized protein YdhG (YjbR/CyaY superfamily)
MTVDSYIKSFPESVQVLLEQVRDTIKENAPDAAESFAYQMPAYKTNGKPLVYFAALIVILGFTQPRQDIQNLQRNFQSTNREKGQFNFRLINQFLLTLSDEL